MSACPIPLLSAVLLLSAGCTSRLTCGPGTSDHDGVCVPVGGPDSGGQPAGDTGVAGDTGGPGDTGVPVTPIFADEFEFLDTDLWALADWLLGDTQFAADQVVADGILTLTHEDDGGDGWKGGEAYSHATFGHARWSARVAAPAETGTVCAFFLYSDVLNGDSAIVNEIDVELLAGAVWFSVYSQWRPEDEYTQSATHRSVVWSAPDTFSVSDWHDYTIQYTADGVRFLVDDELATEITEVVPLGEMRVRFNHWTSSTWTDVGTPPAHQPLTCRVDRVVGVLVE